MTDTRRGGRERRGEGRETAESGGGCGDGVRGRESQAESTGPVAGERGEVRKSAFPMLQGIP